jgi:hypothetical protein
MKSESTYASNPIRSDSKKNNITHPDLLEDLLEWNWVTQEWRLYTLQTKAIRQHKNGDLRFEMTLDKISKLNHDIERQFGRIPTIGLEAKLSEMQQ